MINGDNREERDGIGVEKKRGKKERKAVDGREDGRKGRIMLEDRKEEGACMEGSGGRKKGNNGKEGTM